MIAEIFQCEIMKGKIMLVELKMAQGSIDVIPLGSEYEGKTDFVIVEVSSDILHVKPGDRGSAYRYEEEISLIRNDTMLIGNTSAQAFYEFEREQNGKGE